MKYNLKNDIEITLSSKNIDIDYFSLLSGIPTRTLFYSYNHNASVDTLEKAYSTIYNLKMRLADIKGEVFEESSKGNNIILYHGSKYGIKELSAKGSRNDCDFGCGFYLTRILDSARSFIEMVPSSSIYAFSMSLTDLTILEFNCDLEWMLAICYYRNKIKKYENHPIIKKINEKINSADLIIAPIADNKMFEILNKFANDEITTEEALHALSASRLGKQYVIKTDKALNKLNFLDRFYMCNNEREDSLKNSIDRSNLIQTKLDYAKHEYRSKGIYITEVLDEKPR